LRQINFNGVSNAISPNSEESRMTEPEQDFEADIRTTVRAFYDKARSDDLLGPVFNSIVKDWDQHLRIMDDFWSGALLGTQRYSSAPFPPHVKIKMDQSHFDRWKDLWLPAVAEHLPEVLRAKATSMGEHMAHCWGRAHSTMSKQMAEA
jgi:hemoglobin